MPFQPNKLLEESQNIKKIKRLKIKRLKIKRLKIKRLKIKRLKKDIQNYLD
jgi:hypothetical protein